MKRHTIRPRSQWEKQVESLGMIYHHVEGDLYWNESAYYEFSWEEILQLETATNTLSLLCQQAARHIIEADRFADLDIAPHIGKIITRDFYNSAPSVYGRFDLAYDGTTPPKLLEYNADTPTALLEAAVIQWEWLQHHFPTADQFNSIHERLVTAWKQLSPRLQGSVLYFTSVESEEDLMTANYLRDCAMQAGLLTEFLLIPDIGYDTHRGKFVDLQENTIENIFKLYPWEWLINEPFGAPLVEHYHQMNWIEPLWKMLWSNKGILPILWELFPEHPNLLPAYFEQERPVMAEYVKKPLLSREGANITLVTAQGTQITEGPYGTGAFIYQGFVPLPRFNDVSTVIGSWVINGQSAGIGIRESATPITTDRSQIVPHLFR